MDDILLFRIIDNDQGVSMSVKSSTLSEFVHTERHHDNDDFIRYEVRRCSV